MSVSNIGSRVPVETIAAFDSGSEIRRPDGTISNGLKLLRDSVKEVNDGTAVIESSEKGTSVTLYFAVEQKSKG